MNRQAVFSTVGIVCFLGICLCSCGGDGEPAVGPEAFHPPDERGPFPVGVRTLYPVDGSRWETWGDRYRVLPTEIWYPSSASGGHVNRMADMVGELTPEDMELLAGLLGSDIGDFLQRSTSAIRDAHMRTDAGPFPVIFFSHGFMGLRFQNYTLCEHLASHGFVAVAVDHYGNATFVNVPGQPLVLFNPLDSVASYFDRVDDVDFIFHELEKANVEGLSIWHDLFDLERFAVSGHSYGGLTSLLCGAGHDYVDAIAPLNPAWGGPIADDFSKPFFLLQGENDTFVGPMNKTVRAFQEECSSIRKLYLNLIHGGHYNATDVCVLVPPSLTALAQGCEPPALDFRLANHISNAYMTAFFKSVLYGDQRYDSYLKENHFPEEVELGSSWE
jgi:dienelactone hydrolase